MQLLNSIRAEWLKTKHSAASWLCLIGGVFIPLIFLAGMLKDHRTIDMYTEVPNAWTYYFFQVWQYMQVFLLPMGLILATSLITQVEFRNNTWKMVHTSPQSYAHIFLAKFIVLLGMTALFFLYFNTTWYLSAAIPSLLFDGHLPAATFPFDQFVTSNYKIFLTCMPVLGLQFLLSMHFKNFLVSIGAGLLLLIASLILTGNWEYAYLIPYTYPSISIMSDAAYVEKIHLYALCVGYFVLFISVSYALYISRREKG